MHLEMVPKKFKETLNKLLKNKLYRESSLLLERSESGDSLYKTRNLKKQNLFLLFHLKFPKKIPNFSLVHHLELLLTYMLNLVLVTNIAIFLYNV